MTNIIFIILACYYFAELSNIPQTVKWYINKWLSKVGWKLERLKPFDCVGCLTFWVSAYYHYRHQYTLPFIILYSLGLSAISIILSILIERIRR